MFKGLRRKFVASAVISGAVVITLMAVTLNFINYYKLEQRIDETLHETAKSQTLVALFKEGAENDLVITKNTSSATDSTGFSVAKVNSEGKIENSYRDDALISSQKDLQSYIDKIYTNGQESGFIGSYRYLIAETKTGNVILFLNCQRDLESYYSFVRNTIIISSIVILSVLIIIVMVSKKVIAPIQQSYVKQKQFITDASHELKTPLAIISSNTDVLELEHGNSKWTKNIQNQVEHLTSLVNSLVTFSRMEEKDTVERVKFDLTNTLKSRINDFNELANFQKKFIATDIDSNLYYNGDQQAIIQLIKLM